jgi:hypothetical protein
MNDFSAEVGGLIVAFGGGTYSLIALETAWLIFFSENRRRVKRRLVINKNIYPIKIFD